MGGVRYNGTTMTGVKLPSLFLIGYRAVGKTTIGQLIAELLKIPFLDTDMMIEKSLGITIAECFSQSGEAFFRDQESSSLDEISKRMQSGGTFVVSTGGGIILREENVLLMRSLGKVVWLRASPPTIRERLESDPKTALSRPGLTGASPVLEVEKVLSEREPLYQRAAHYDIKTDDIKTDDIKTDDIKTDGINSPRPLAESIIKWLKTCGEESESLDS